VAMASENLVPNNIHNVGASFSVKDYLKWEEEYYYPILYEGQNVKLVDVFPDYAPKGDLYYPVDKIPFITTNEMRGNGMEAIREMRLLSTSKFLNIDQEKISFYRHHRCHAFYGYYVNSNKKEKITVVTSDAGGDGAYTSIYGVDKGVFSKINESRNCLIGKIYTSVTLLLGMRPNEHEYKVMGLAPYASEYQKAGPREVFMNALSVDGIDFVKDPEMMDFFFYFRERLKPYRFDGIAGGLQDFVEARLCEWFNNLVRDVGNRDFVFCGGVANNVKANKRILELDGVSSVFVPPGPGDENLSIGAAYCAIYDQMGPEKAMETIKPLRDAFWGGDVDPNDHQSFKEHEFIMENYERFDEYSLSDVARLIAGGEVVGICQGRMEFGPRALGHRSLVADPSNPDSVRKINDLIKKRDFWMPFTPSILDECFEEYVLNSKEIDTAYMTITCDSTEKARDHLKAAIHPYDYTVRPQRVTRETCDFYYNLIKAFRKITGIGAVLNTSLNIHGRPIVMNPTDLLREILMDGNIELKYLCIGNSFYKKKNSLGI